MNIPEPIKSGKDRLGRIPRDYLVLGILVLSASASFMLGVLAGRDMSQSTGTSGFWVEDAPPEVTLPAGGGPAAAVTAPKPVPITKEPQTPSSEVYVASKTGEKYYLTTCGNAKRIKEENRIYFSTKAEAEAKGYEPAANCPGL